MIDNRIIQNQNGIIQYVVIFNFDESEHPDLTPPSHNRSAGVQRTQSILFQFDTNTISLRDFKHFCQKTNKHHIAKVVLQVARV